MKNIREVNADTIRDAVEALCIEANTSLPVDVKAALDRAEATESWPLAKQTLGLCSKIFAWRPSKNCRFVRIPAWPVSFWK